MCGIRYAEKRRKEEGWIPNGAFIDGNIRSGGLSGSRKVQKIFISERAWSFIASEKNVVLFKRRRKLLTVTVFREVK